MKKRYIFGILTACMGFYFMFPQSTGEPLIAEAATAAVEPQMQAVVEAAAPAEEPAGEPVECAAEEEVRYREGLAAYITSVNHTVTEAEAQTMVDCILEQAAEYDLDEKLLMAMAHTESTYYSDAVSCADYKGLMQTGDVLAEEAGYSPEDLFDPEVSIEVGAGYIDAQLETFDDTELALTAYNQGPGAVYAGDYSTGYAETTLKRVENIENFLSEGGYSD